MRWTAARSTTCQFSPLLSVVLPSLCLLLLTSGRWVTAQAQHVPLSYVYAMICKFSFSSFHKIRLDTTPAQWKSPPPTCPLKMASPCGSLETCSSESTTPSTTAPTTASALPQLCNLTWLWTWSDNMVYTGVLSNTAENPRRWYILNICHSLDSMEILRSICHCKSTVKILFYNLQTVHRSQWTTTMSKLKGIKREPTLLYLNVSSF